MQSTIFGNQPSPTTVRSNFEPLLPSFQLPRDPWRQRANPLINVLEVDEPNRCSVSFHFMPRPPPELPELPPALAPSPLETQRAVAEAALADARELGATEGFILKNLEKDCE